MKKTQTMIKICGVKCPQMAGKVANLGASHVGIMLHAQSKRYVNLECASTIAQAALREGAVPVAVCVNQTARQMSALCDALAIDTVQLHGPMARSQHQLLPDSITRIYVLHVDALGNVVNKKDPYIQQLNQDRDLLLFDGLVGGAGAKIKTKNIHAVAAGFRYLIAGGLNADNVQAVGLGCAPVGFDVSSGVEDNYGSKDLTRIKDFIAAVKARGGGP